MAAGARGGDDGRRGEAVRQGHQDGVRAQLFQERLPVAVERSVAERGGDQRPGRLRVGVVEPDDLDLGEEREPLA